MSPDDYVAMQLRLECIGFDQDGRLIRIPGPDPDDLGRVYGCRHEGGYRLHVRSDVSGAASAALQALGAETAFRDAAAVQTILARDRPGAAARFEVHSLLDRALCWQFGHRHGVWWDPSLTFGEWASPYVFLDVF